jgi:hypothetical protein
MRAAGMTCRRGSQLTSAVFLALLMLGMLGGQVLATWDLPDDPYTAGFWDDGDEDALLSLVWDHSSATLTGFVFSVALWVAPLAMGPPPHSADTASLSSFDSRAPPLA